MDRRIGPHSMASSSTHLSRISASALFLFKKKINLRKKKESRSAKRRRPTRPSFLFFFLCFALLWLVEFFLFFSFVVVIFFGFEDSTSSHSIRSTVRTWIDQREREKWAELIVLFVFLLVNTAAVSGKKKPGNNPVKALN